MSTPNAASSKVKSKRTNVSLPLRARVELAVLAPPPKKSPKPPKPPTSPNTLLKISFKSISPGSKPPKPDAPVPSNAAEPN